MSLKMMKTRQLSTLIVLFVLLATGSSVAAIGQSLALVADGQAHTTILLAEKPTSSAQLAAYELQYYIEKISGVHLSIVQEPQAATGAVILVGQSNAAKKLGYHNDTFDPQEYTIKTFPQALLLMGYDAQKFSRVRYDDYKSLYKAVSDPIGTCYAVCSFLENNLGVRWYYPNEEIGEVIPNQATIAVKNLDIRRSPDAPVRPIYPLFINTEKLYYTDWDEPAKFQTSLINARTSLLYWIRHRFWTRYTTNHSFVDYDVAFGKSHPEWFSTKSWEKMQEISVKPEGYQMGIQPCLTAPGFFEQVTQIARDYYDGKEAKYGGFVRSATGNFFSVVPNDNTNMCDCPTCRVQYSNEAGVYGNASNYVWDFVNRVAREVRKTHPNAIISGLAYFNYTTPPTDMIFESNVAVMFCKFYYDYWDKASRDRDYQLITEYVEKNKVQFFTTWEYLIKPSYAYGCFPCLVPHTQDQDVKWLGERGFKGGSLQYQGVQTYNGAKPDGGFAQASPVLDFMNLYWRMKLYDNFNFDIDRGLDEYYEKFFGPGAAGMREFYTAMETRWNDSEIRKGSGGSSSPRVWWGVLGTSEFMDEVAGYIQQAKDATAEDTIYRKRVELIDLGIMQHMRKGRTKYEKSAISEFSPIATAGVAARDSSASANWANDTTWADAMASEIDKTILNKPVNQGTIFKLAYDARNLYIYAKCLEPKVSQIKAATHDHDVGGFSDDSLELFLDPSGRGKTYYHLCINSNGAVYDALETPSAPGATATLTWNSEIKVKTHVGKDYWEMRAALPLSSLVKNPPRPGEIWRFNICRNRFVESSGPRQIFSAWSVTLGTFQNPDRFGIITFNTPKNRGRTLWREDFDNNAYASDSGESPLIGLNGWYENTLYADRGWDRSWKVINRGGNHLAECNINETNHSEVVPMHAVRVLPGVVSVEVDYRRLAVEGNDPTLFVTDVNGKYICSFHTCEGRSDLVTLEIPGNRQNYTNNKHGLGTFSAAGKWFSLKIVIDTVQKNVTGYLRSNRNKWVRLNKTPLPYRDPQAEGTDLFVGFGSRRYGSVENNILEMDNIRVTQVKYQKTQEDN